MKPHRQILEENHLCLLDPEIGVGLPVWLPKGLKIRRKIENHVRRVLEASGYEEVDSPHIGAIELYRQSGHYPYYAESQYDPIPAKDESKSGWLLKPMNCPHHIKCYQAGPKSYRDLPVRLYEFGKVYRFESAGAVNGLLRARAFIQDDGHLFLAEEDLREEIQSEILRFAEILKPFASCGLENPQLCLSLRDPHSDKYVGEPALWEKAEAYAREALVAAGLPFEEHVGEAAFYGPKIDFHAKDAQGRSWQLGSIQIDFNLPERFALEYVNPAGGKSRPVMIHRAALGSLERFVAILLEANQGRLPAWLAPEPLAILPIGGDQSAYAHELAQKAKALGVAPLILEDDSLPKRVALAESRHIPIIWVVGKREVEDQSVSVRGKKGAIPAEDALNELKMSLLGGKP